LPPSFAKYAEAVGCPCFTIDDPKNAEDMLKQAFAVHVLAGNSLRQKMGRVEDAETILDRAEALAGPVGLFAEGVDARSGDFLGNTPLLFSQVEYVRAVREIAKARGSDRHDDSSIEWL
jgi:hypothetical protein